MKIKDMPEHERPLERLLAEGPAALSNTELLAIILGSGSREQDALALSRTLIGVFGGLRGLSRSSVRSLSAVTGVGPVKGCRIRAALELAVRLVQEETPAGTVVRRAADIAPALIADMGRLSREILKVVLLTSRGEIIKIVKATEGTLLEGDASPREVFKHAIYERAAAVIVVHNHPSGDPSPSRDDIVTTHRLVQCGDVLDIPVRDHLIIGGNRWTSLKEEGYL